MSGKLRGAAKEAFLKRMAAGRRKATRGSTKRKKPSKKGSASKKGSQRKNSKLTGAAKAAFLERMAAGRRRAANAGPRSVRKSKKEMKKFLPGFKRKKRRNQEGDMQEASRQFETFHQRPPARIIEMSQQFKYPGEFAEMGKLKQLRFDLDGSNKDFPLTHFGNCMAVCTPDGANIYFLGGDQKVDLAALDIDSDKDFVELGPCRYIMYHTTKGFHDFEPIDYYHRFGEEDGIFPDLVYDRLNQALFLVSGNYRVRAAGIEN